MRPSIVPVAVLLLSMVSSGAAAQEWNEIKKSEAVLHVVLPDLSNPVERFVWKSRTDHSGIDNYTIVAPRSANYPRAQVFYQQVSPGYSVQALGNLDEAWLKWFAFLKDKPLSLSEATGDGAKRIRRFEVEHSACFAFSIAPDGVVDRYSAGGKKWAEGYYCAMPGIRLTDRDIHAVLYGIRIFDKAGGPYATLAPAPPIPGQAQK
jgi:hypothetical protein